MYVMQILKNEGLAAYTSFGTGGPAETLIKVEKTDEIIEALKASEPPIWFLGSGANVLISDEGLPGATLHLDTHDIEFKEQDGTTVVIADAGVEWDQLVRESIERGKWGFERTSGIPGSVGAAVVGNIAAYGQAVSDTLMWIEAINVSDRHMDHVCLSADELGLGYRTSDFQTPTLKDYIVVRAAFKLENKPRELEYASALKVADEKGWNPENLNERRDIIMEARRRAGSLLDKKTNAKTAGSFFKNPDVTPEQAERIMSFEENAVSQKDIKSQNKIHGGKTTRVSAAHVLLAAGFKRGQSWGPVRLHPEHVLKIENTGDATSQQIYDVAQEIIQTVKEKLGVDLVPEVRTLGKFS